VEYFSFTQTKATFLNMQKSFQYFQKKITYRVIGKGIPVLLIHGFGEDSHIWDKQIAHLQDHCLLVVPDLPGTGLSEIIRPADLSKENESPISMNDYAALLATILKEENISNCIIFGHSMGGYITLAFEEMYPELSLRFGLVHSSALADSEEKKGNRLKGIEMMELYGAGPFLKNTIPNLFSAGFKKEHPETVALLVEAAPVFNTQACQQYYQAMMFRPDRTSILKGNPKPILFVIGTEDVAATLTDLLPQIKLPAHPQVHILEGVGHMGMWEATEQVNQFLLDFIEL
jgi:pimeloyl-ACP methyl ester carboxylesterase